MKRTKKNIIGMVAGLLLTLCLAGVVFAQGDTVTVSVRGKLDYQKAYQVLEYTNQIRKQAGVQPLTMDRELLAAAMQRAAEIAVIFDHSRPDGSDCFTISSRMTGENIAAGQTSASAAVSSWKSSSGHYQNMVNSSYKSIGIGCFYYEGIYYWTQCFGWPEAAAVSRPADQTRTMTMQIARPLIHENFLAMNGLPKPMKAGENADLELLYRFGDYSFVVGAFTWDHFTLTSENPQIVAVTGTGRIRALKPGTAKLVLRHREIPEKAWVVTCTVSNPNSRKVIFNANGGSLSKTSSVKTSTVQVTYKQKYGKLPVPVRKGYVFKGWYTKKSGGSKVTASKKVTIAKGKTQTLYAHWSKITVSKAAISRLSKGKGGSGITVKWKKISGASGYEVCVSASSKFRSDSTQVKRLTKGSAQSVSFSGLTKGKKYYCRVRAYKTDALGNRIYGKYSTAKSVKL